MDAEAARRGSIRPEDVRPPVNSFTVAGQTFQLRADRSRVPERMGPIAELDLNGDPREILEAYRAFIRGEVRYADRERWALAEEQLELADLLDLIGWIIAPWTGPISESEALKIKRKTLQEAVWPN